MLDTGVQRIVNSTIQEVLGITFFDLLIEVKMRNREGERFLMNHLKIISEELKSNN